MAVTQNTYTGNGSTTNYSFTFPYLETTDIKVSLNGTVTTAYTLANATTIQFNTAPANGAAIRIYRVTDDAQLSAQFYPGSAIRSQDLNDNFTQNLYVTQESNREAATAIATADGAVTTANAATATANSAVSTANAATATANSAVSTANAAVATANTASTNASAAVSTANTASTNATAAVNTANAATATANSAAADAATAISTANSAVTTANAATATANTASTNASAAVATANTASTTAGNAVTTANSAVTTAGNAVTTANSAVTTANGAVSTANSAVTTANNAVSTANAAASAVANAILYDVVANVAAIPASPVNNDAVEVVDSTGIQSFTPLSGVPAGFTGSSGLSVRMVYTTSGSTWNWIQYFPNDPESRYLKLSGGTLTGQLKADDSTSAAAPVYSFDGDTNTGLAHTGADELALVTGGTARLTIDSTGSVNVPVLAPNIVDAGYVNIYNDSVFYDADSSNYIGFKAPTTVASNVTFTLPNGDGSAGQFLSTNGSGALSWTSVDLSAKLDSATAASTYQTLAGMSSYLTTANAATTYQTQAGMSSYAPLASPTFTGQPYVNGSYRANITAVAALNIDCSLGNLFTKTINGNSTFTVSNVPASRSYAFTLELTHTSGTITWFSGVVWPGGTAPTLTTGKVHLFMFLTDDGGTTWRASSLVNY